MHYILDASYQDDHKLKITFTNNEVRIVDLSEHLDGSVFEPLKDLRYFRMFKVNRDIDTIVRPNHADFSPDFLYEIGEPISEQAAGSKTRERSSPGFLNRHEQFPTVP